MSVDRVDYVVVGLGALGSAAAMELARRGHQVVGLERFGLGHSRGASHDTSRILRHSYHTPGYVRLTQEAYADWAALERDSGEALVTTVGGLDLFPPGAAIPLADYTGSLEAVGIDHEVLDVAQVQDRWPQLHLPEGTRTLFQADAAIVPAARGTATLQQRARAHGALLRDRTAVTALEPVGERVEVHTADGVLSAGGVVVCADAWVNELLDGLGERLPVMTTLEQVTYFGLDRPADVATGRLPLWIWMDDPSFYGFPCYGEPTVKAAQDCGGPVVDPSTRAPVDEVDEQLEGRLADHLRRMLPGVGRPVRSLRCQYTLTPDRDLVLAPVPGHPRVVVGLGAAHGFKFAPTIGRHLADLVTRRRRQVAWAHASHDDLAAFRWDRPGITDAAYEPTWLV